MRRLPAADLPTPALLTGSVQGFTSRIATLARGPAVNFGARAPVLRLLQSISASCDSCAFVEDSCRDWPGDAASIRTAWHNGALATFFAQEGEPTLLTFHQRLGLLQVSSEPFRAALQHTDWTAIERGLPHLNLTQDVSYDVSLSFSREDRPFVESLFGALTAMGYSVFYDFNEQDRILGEHVDDLLEAVFTRQSRYVVVVLSNSYGRRRPHYFEADLLHTKIDRDRILPIVDIARGFGPLDSLFPQGHLWWDTTKDLGEQAAGHAEIISRKIAREVSSLLRERRC